MSMPVTQATVYEALRTVSDPELPISVVDLGLIYDVRVDGGAVEIDMTLTSMGCPCHDLIVDDVKAAVAAIEGVVDSTVNVVWDPPWNRDRLSGNGRRILPMVGIAP